MSHDSLPFLFLIGKPHEFQFTVLAFLHFEETEQIYPLISI
jgi:hypothetical protein